MNKQIFWDNLQRLITRKDKSEIVQAQWERVAQLATAPTLPAKLIIDTVCDGAIYLTEKADLNLPAVAPNLTLSANQHIALEMALSNSAIALISGSPATGKTSISISLAAAAINHQKRVLILSYHHATLKPYRNLPSYPFLLSQQQDYDSWLITQLRCQHLAAPQMDYLPLYLLPDQELAKLRTREKLETWLPKIEEYSHQELAESLKPEFSDLSPERIQLIAYRLKQLLPLLKQQLSLAQQYTNLSDLGKQELAAQLAANSHLPILGTVAEFMQPQHRYLWQTMFDLVIVEEAHYLSCLELMLLSALGQKIVLFGEEIAETKSSTNNVNFNRLYNSLLPSYRYCLSTQFRLHPQLAIPIYKVIGDRWIHNHTQREHLFLPQLQNRLIWQEVPTPIAAQKIIEFLQTFTPEISSQIGIITFTKTQTDLIKNQCPPEYADILIGTVTEWAGEERAIVLISCGDNPQLTTPAAINIALTRAKDYLILFGQQNFWEQTNTLLASLLDRPELSKQRTVIMGYAS